MKYEDVQFAAAGSSSSGMRSKEIGVSSIHTWNSEWGSTRRLGLLFTLIWMKFTIGSWEMYVEIVIRDSPKRNAVNVRVNTFDTESYSKKCTYYGHTVTRCHRRYGSFSIFSSVRTDDARPPVLLAERSIAVWRMCAVQCPKEKKIALKTRS